MENSPFIKQLSSNNRVVREKALEALQKVLTSEKFMKAKQIQYEKLWKALYYTMWFSDRPRPQQKLARQLGELFMLYAKDSDNDSSEILLSDKAFMKFCRAFWKVMCLEWFNIDRYRLDKYLLLVRRVMFNQLKYLQTRNWNETLVEMYIDKVLKHSPLSGSSKIYNGIPFHIIDIFLDEYERLASNRDDEFDVEDEITDEDKIAELLKETPLQSFVDIFIDLQKDIMNSKGLRNKIKEDLLSDERLTQWGAKGIDASRNKEQNDSDKEEEEVVDANAVNAEDEPEEEEWKGF
ncbi:similar to Saccharomyces cerevisiae YDR087C RRP1 Essential evolutionarily conserved nucleolar protein necessary for biogenesis of 60S ribosomal subunits and processing of pre-rRNAs to mature rRNAs [Maudiozyma barnettii]|uniref:Similar to Saccharomyces cerevisiae YDR087C RRP1 Essential evolutionarily conserved nucleolar protein necessary for biogenesis of 60S ribosomal subunits and processing of pre-rRNAs to mature rRNAs n=1 Tax=Maudiozyma barnettii TaxID=61262 RepID=A0A8H2ZHG3_9SACH|nr:Rrp1p [Kazachstania barnettii]CAB4255729.1 similar to Saccharomyces cerevisiae YDR087C RRP1 Essential evolutionarily conserved nucleolar protein necessary for biogenesis of 60S ribosomal subunits and processing of pre-rRNAs to mature rRNAs [Kazachstania barnettii]CAD1784290.1 similar to Saccharomyces cerevisiae YDR087C RRP1 Essential evolutionarily conserved nucleolar protein necessary for biogenesis of 60S ribosomal subunits and processing of pre-rRNAs to mature rRNAs [Kazachstania barnettii]